MSTAKSGTIVRLLERFQEQRSSPASRSRFHITTDPNLTSVLLVALIGLLVTTSISSFLGHYRRGAVNIDVLRAWTVPIVVGVFAGIVAASFAKPVLFKIVFIVVSLLLAIRLLAGMGTWKLGEKLA